jgi:hypothetical protein
VQQVHDGTLEKCPTLMMTALAAHSLSLKVIQSPF